MLKIQVRKQLRIGRCRREIQHRSIRVVFRIGFHQYRVISALRNGIDEMAFFQLRISANHSALAARVSARQLANGRQLLAPAKRAVYDPGFDLVHDFGVFSQFHLLHLL